MKNKNGNKLLIGVSAIIVIVGLILFVVAGYLKGWNILGWFSSPMAIWCYFLVGAYILFLIIYFLWEKYKKL